MRDLSRELTGLFDARQCEVAAVDDEGRCGDLVEQWSDVHGREVAYQRRRCARPGAHALQPGAELEIVTKVRDRRRRQLAATPNSTNTVRKFLELLRRCTQRVTEGRCGGLSGGVAV